MSSQMKGIYLHFENFLPECFFKTLQPHNWLFSDCVKMHFLVVLAIIPQVKKRKTITVKSAKFSTKINKNL